MRVREIGLIGLLLSLSLVLQISPLKVPTQWGMTIDLVAVPVVVIYILLGFWSSVMALILLFLGLSLISSASWLGASMKFFATLSVIMGLEIAKKLTKFDFKHHKEKDFIIFVLVACLIGIAIRIPANEIALKLAYKFPITATSANLHGGSLPVSIEIVKKQLGKKPDIYLDYGKLSGLPSTVVDVSCQKIKIIREGAIKKEELYV